jgi:hypothetical protein
MGEEGKTQEMNPEDYDKDKTMDVSSGTLPVTADMNRVRKEFVEFNNDYVVQDQQAKDLMTSILKRRADRLALLEEMDSQLKKENDQLENFKNSKLGEV